MSKVHIYLYILVTLLCVCMVMCDGNHTTLSGNTTEASKTDSASTVWSESSSPNAAIKQDIETSPDTSTDYPEDDSGLTPNSSKDYSDYMPAYHSEMTTDSTQSSAFPTTRPTVVAVNSGPMTLGVIFLLLFSIIIIGLVFILYIQWKKGRSYSFDLTHLNNDDTPLRSMEHGGTFEQTSKELSLDYIQDDKPQETNPTANGCAGETAKQEPNSEQQNVPEEDSFISDTSQTPPIKKVEFNLDLDLLGGEPEVMDQAKAENNEPEQNENNNNVTSNGHDSLDLFTEINLDEPQ